MKAPFFFFYELRRPVLFKLLHLRNPFSDGNIARKPFLRIYDIRKKKIYVYICFECPEIGHPFIYKVFSLKM
jgi:hypothetical protein